MTTAPAPTPAAVALQARLLDFWPNLSRPRCASLADEALEAARGNGDLALAAVDAFAREAIGTPTAARLRKACDDIDRAAVIERGRAEQQLRREYERQRADAIGRLRDAVREWVAGARDAEVVELADTLRARVADDPFALQLFDLQRERLAGTPGKADIARAVLTRTLLLFDLEALLVERGAIEASPLIALDFAAWRRCWGGVA